ncbi:MAG: hypothetical protein IE884_08660 [Sulfuricurvum sp.]|nr:hypothetical protein [Sulfuricurvum sp.]
MHKIFLAGMLSCSALMAGEMQYGKGKFEIEGGFLGLTSTIDADVSIYSMAEQHKNIGSSNFFYKYNLSWYDSEDLVQVQQTYNTGVSQTMPGFNTPVSSVPLPTMDYRVQGLDVNLVLGYDPVHVDENNYAGVGVAVGISLPWIDSQKDSSNSNDQGTPDELKDAFKKSKTKMYTYKIGPNIALRKSLGDYFSVYGSGTYAYQTATMKNDYTRTDLSVDGIFQEYDAGIRFQPVAFEKEIGWFTLSPRLYATLGYRYTRWDLNNVALGISSVDILDHIFLSLIAAQIANGR